MSRRNCRGRGRVGRMGGENEAKTQLFNCHRHSHLPQRVADAKYLLQEDSKRKPQKTKKPKSTFE